MTAYDFTSFTIAQLRTMHATQMETARKVLSGKLRMDEAGAQRLVDARNALAKELARRARAAQAAGHDVSSIEANINRLEKL